MTLDLAPAFNRAHKQLEYDIGIGYGDDVELACSLMLSTVRITQGVLAEPAPDVLLLELGAASVNLPFPTQQILFHDQAEESEGDRRRQREGWPAGKADVPAPRKIADTIAQTSPSTRPQDEDRE